MIGLAKYSKIKDNYCLCYFGNCHEYLVQLKLIIPAIKRRFNDLNIFLSCRDEFVCFLNNCEVVPLSLLKSKKEDFAFVKEIRFDNTKNHPLEVFLEESDILDIAVNVEANEEPTVKCVFITKGTYPTKSLITSQILKVERLVADEGYEIDIDGCIDNAGWVIGVESANLYEAAARGIRTTLIPTGIGTNLYKKMFPQGEILAI